MQEGTKTTETVELTEREKGLILRALLHLRASVLIPETSQDLRDLYTKLGGPNVFV